jgi:hypothetical protein
MNTNRVRRRPRPGGAAALTAALLLSTVGSAGVAYGATSRTVTHPKDGLQVLRAAAATAAAAAPGGVDRAAYQAGVEAFIWGAPLVAMARTRAALVCAAGVNAFLDQNTLAGPSSRLVVTPNTDTLYSSAWLDLRAGPVRLRIPALADRYYSFQFLDMYTNTITNVGSRTIGQGPASVAVTGPSWKGQLPAGTRRISSPTPDVWVIGRTLPKSDADVATVVALQRQYALTPVASDGSPLGPDPTQCGRPGPATVSAAGAAFFDELGVALAADPPPKADAPVLHDLSTVGIGVGMRPSTHASPAVLAALGASIPAANATIAATAARNLTVVDGWSRQQHLGTYGRAYVTRAAVAETALGSNVPAESVYYSTGADRAGTSLVGTGPVILHFGAGQLPPVDRNGFWSVTLYGPDHFLVANQLRRYSIGDRTPGLQRAPDGSLDLYLGAQPPPGHEANWLPAPPGGYSLVLRAYVPGAAIRQGTWRPPTIRPQIP